MHVARALAGEEVSYEARVDFGPGHTRDVRVTYVPDRDASGRVRGFVSRVTDISDSAERRARPPGERAHARGVARPRRTWAAGRRC